jgi:hypothetical protein
MSEETIHAKVPWYELDRMIVESLKSGNWELTGYVVSTVMWRCVDRKLPMTEHEIIRRVEEMVDLAVLAVTGDLWGEDWSLRSAVCIVVGD